MSGSGWKQSPVVAVIAIVILVAAAGWIGSHFVGGGGGKYAGGRYFLDLETGELVTIDSVKSPVQTDEGHEAVQAHVYSCGSCEDEGSRFVGHLVKYSPEALAAMDKPREEREPFVIQEGTFVSGHSDDPDWEPNWVPAQSGQGMTLQETAMRRCDTPAECTP